MSDTTRNIETDFWWDTRDVDTNYATHGFHPYPAKFIPQIPRRAIHRFTDEGDTVLDPFMGCGTTLVESKLANRSAFGTDTNPIAGLISKVKTTTIPEELLATVPSLINQIERDVTKLYNETFDDEEIIEYRIPDFHNRDHWFERHVQEELAVILAHIEDVPDRDLADFLKVCVSSIVVKVSNQDSDTRYAATGTDAGARDTFDAFKVATLDNLQGLRELNRRAGSTRVDIFEQDARELRFLDDDQVDLIVTSPPYANTYDYYLYHKMRMFWLGFDFKEAQESEIGSRYRYSSQKEDPTTYFDNLTSSLEEMQRVLRPGGVAVFIIGDSVIRGEFIRMDRTIERICQGLSLDITNRIQQELSTFTSFNKSFGSQDKREYILFLEH